MEVLWFLCGALTAALACGAYAWTQGWRPFPPEPTVPRKAMLMNAQGGVDSVRTITGRAPLQFVARAGTYDLDRAAISPHLVYRIKP